MQITDWLCNLTTLEDFWQLQHNKSKATTCDTICVTTYLCSELWLVEGWWWVHVKTPLHQLITWTSCGTSCNTRLTHYNKIWSMHASINHSFFKIVHRNLKSYQKIRSKKWKIFCQSIDLLSFLYLPNFFILLIFFCGMFSKPLVRYENKVL